MMNRREFIQSTMALAATLVLGLTPRKHSSESEYEDILAMAVQSNSLHPLRWELYEFGKGRNSMSGPRYEGTVAIPHMAWFTGHHGISPNEIGVIWKPKVNGAILRTGVDNRVFMHDSLPRGTHITYAIRTPTTVLMGDDSHNSDGSRSCCGGRLTHPNDLACFRENNPQLWNAIRLKLHIPASNPPRVFRNG